MLFCLWFKMVEFIVGFFINIFFFVFWCKCLLFINVFWDGDWICLYLCLWIWFWFYVWWDNERWLEGIFINCWCKGVLIVGLMVGLIEWEIVVLGEWVWFFMDNLDKENVKGVCFFWYNLKLFVGFGVCFICLLRFIDCVGVDCVVGCMFFICCIWLIIVFFEWIVFNDILFFFLCCVFCLMKLFFFGIFRIIFFFILLFGNFMGVFDIFILLSLWLIFLLVVIIKFVSDKGFIFLKIILVFDVFWGLMYGVVFRVGFVLFFLVLVFVRLFGVVDIEFEYLVVMGFIFVGWFLMLFMNIDVGLLRENVNFINEEEFFIWL